MVSRGKRFTIKEIEPFLKVEYRPDACDGGLFCAVLGVAIQKENGAWGTHELSDETDGGLSRKVATCAEPFERLESRASRLLKKRLVDALNRLKEHYERVYVYPIAAERRPLAPE